MSEPEKRDTDITLPDVDNAPLGSQSSTKENDAPLDLSAAAKPPVPKFDQQSSSQSAQQQADSIETQPETLPPDLLSSYQFSTRLLDYHLSSDRCYF